MIKVEKIGNGISPDIRISDETKSFMIARNSLPDLCWYPEINYFKNDLDITFTIREDDGNIFTLFNKLYQDVIEGNIFPLKEEDIRNKSPEAIKKLKLEKKKERAQYQEDAKRSGLVTNGVISWHSEDYDPYNLASVLTISKINGEIVITFKKNKNNFENLFNMSTYNVRITESGSMYYLFFVIFVNFRRQLQALEWDEPTITSEVKKLVISQENGS